MDLQEEKRKLIDERNYWVQYEDYARNKLITVTSETGRKYYHDRYKKLVKNLNKIRQRLAEIRTRELQELIQSSGLKEEVREYEQDRELNQELNQEINGRNP